MSKTPRCATQIKTVKGGEPWTGEGTTKNAKKQSRGVLLEKGGKAPKGEK